MTFLCKKKGTTLVEWIVVAAIVVTLVGGITWQIVTRLQTKYVDIYNGL